MKILGTLFVFKVETRYSYRRDKMLKYPKRLLQILRVSPVCSSAFLVIVSEATTYYSLWKHANYCKGQFNLLKPSSDPFVSIYLNP